MPKLKLFNLALTERERKQARALARKHNISMSEVFRQGLAILAQGKAVIQPTQTIIRSVSLQSTGTER